MDEKSTLQQFLNTRDMLNWIDMKISYLTVKPQREIHYRPDKTPVSNHRETQRFSLPWIRYLFVFWSMIRSKKKAPQSRFQRLNLKIPSRWSTDMCEFIQLRKKQFYFFLFAHNVYSNEFVPRVLSLNGNVRSEIHFRDVVNWDKSKFLRWLFWEYKHIDPLVSVQYDFVGNLFVLINVT